MYVPFLFQRTKNLPPRPKFGRISVIRIPPKKNLKLSAVRLRRLSVRQLADSRGEFLAATGGESGSD
ncbi:MAG: hypothetical protein A2941_03020 [Candidatus Yanofskybacteria bacterium RIFCSPLOWO2_01_FULL_49_17]|uniref:Uncharacterized protein n=1 Tax=Candidatus Yanofskybacteria bacterium RIFCSPLOWO2_01_FULL_49_17 TaxID=1802700 RepID=A0A1F8GRC8_9BACT|nr:MAG: hypothetical protein A2941_03020 [Candidatus Yanofskybacteria bacterium RIFCSPLOWO2_01_FULL_49_17]